MTGQEHYAEAERLLAGSVDEDIPPVVGADFQRRAQVHATLALVAATALNGHMPGMLAHEQDAWLIAAGSPDPHEGEPAVTS